MITFVTKWCSYCTIVEEEILSPMIKSGEYEGKVIIIKVDIDESEINLKYDIGMVPTMIFVDYTGNELANRIIGVPPLDFFGQFVDDAINTAVDKLRR